MAAEAEAYREAKAKVSIAYIYKQRASTIQNVILSLISFIINIINITLSML